MSSWLMMYTGPFLRRLLSGGDPGEVVGPVETVRRREVDVGRPDDVGVADVPVVPEGVN